MDGTQGTGLGCQEGNCQICPPFHNRGSPELLPPIRTVLSGVLCPSTGTHRAEHSWGLPGALPCTSGSVHLNNGPGYGMLTRHMVPEGPGRWHRIYNILSPFPQTMPPSIVGRSTLDPAWDPDSTSSPTASTTLAKSPSSKELQCPHPQCHCTKENGKFCP